MEFMQHREQSEDKFQYELDNWKENLFVVFGTTNVVEMILPMEREIPLTGLEWTFANYDEQGGDTEKLL